MPSALQESIVSDLLKTDQSSDRYAALCSALHVALSPAQRDQLRQLVTAGPVYDGDVVSKAARDDLLELGIASRACVRAEQGYMVANYRGWDVLRAGK